MLSVALVLVLCGGGNAWAVGPAEAPVLEMCGPRAGDRDNEEFTRIRFRIRGSYRGDIEFFQFKSVKYIQTVQQQTPAAAEYEVALPAVFESVSFNVQAGPACRAVDTRRMSLLSGVDPEISRLFGRPEIEFALRSKAAAVVVLYLICAAIVLRSGPGPRRSAALAAATLLFAAGEIFLLRSEVREVSVTLHEGRTGGVPYSYEFVGLGCPLGGRSVLARSRGVIFPVHETIQGLLGDGLRIGLAGKGSSVKGLVLERGRYRTFCCMSEEGLGGEMEMRGGTIVNMTGFDMPKAFLWRQGRLFDLGELPNGGRSDPRRAPIVSRGLVIEEAGRHLVSAALNLLSWRMGRLDSGNVVFGFVSSSRIVFFEAAQDDSPD